MARFFATPTIAETQAARQVTEAALDRHLETQVKRQKKLCLWAAIWISLSAIAVIIALVVINARGFSRLPDVAVTDSQELESLPSLIKTVTVDTEVFAVEFTESLVEDTSNLFYYFNLYGNAAIIEEELGIENPTLYVVPDLVSMESLLRIGPINDVAFPYKLPDSFLPGNFEGIALAEDDRMEGDKVFVAPFVVVDESRNIGSPNPAPISIPQTSVPPPVQAPANPPPTNTPPAAPTVLVADLEGRSSYNIDGSITIDTVRGFEGGQVVEIPRLQFDVDAASAPAPYLYLSKRPYSETRRGDLDDDDILIEIDGIRDGTFTKGGIFEQVLDEIGSAQDLSEYDGGSFIIWCRPFEIYLGGGPIKASI